ncbi:hypothetical protein K469DRAFT_471478, partial [Zopfia rhizophila CBS 207.26]
MGVISTSKVVTGSERRHRLKAVQPGNREWVTDLLPGWAIVMSENGWTTNEIGAEWLEHFDMHTK